jgi:Predicted membrane protein
MNSEQDSVEKGLWERIKPLTEIGAQKRPLGFVIVATLAVGLPVLIGAALDRFSASVLAGLGGLVILYMRQANFFRRIAILKACSAGFALSFLFGTFTSFNPALSAFTLAVTAFLATLICRYFRVPPPGSFFFILVASVSRTLPYDVELIPMRTGVLLAGCVGAILLASIYALIQKKPSAPASPTADNRPLDKTALVLDASVIALFVGGGYMLALSVGLDNPYWVPISTAAIMQGATFQAVWHRNVHRIVGTMIGMGVAWLIFSLSPGPWTLAVLIMSLSFLVELLVTRNYGLAVIFITPLTVILADANYIGGDVHTLMTARLTDVVIGSLIGYTGGWVIHHKRWFQAIEARLVRRRD